MLHGGKRFGRRGGIGRQCRELPVRGNRLPLGHGVPHEGPVLRRSRYRLDRSAGRGRRRGVSLGSRRGVAPVPEYGSVRAGAGSCCVFCGGLGPGRLEEGARRVRRRVRSRLLLHGVHAADRGVFGGGLPHPVLRLSIGGRGWSSMSRAETSRGGHAGGRAGCARVRRLAVGGGAFPALHARGGCGVLAADPLEDAGSAERARHGVRRVSCAAGDGMSRRGWRAVHAAPAALSLVDVLVCAGVLHLLRVGCRGRYFAQARTVGVLVYRSLSHRRTGRDTGSSASGDGTVRRVQDRREDSCIRSRARREPFEGAFSGRRCRRLPRIELLAGSRGARTGPGRVPGHRRYRNGSQ